MATLKAQSAGGIATGIKLRREAVEKYYLNPNVCLHCGSVIKIEKNAKVTDVRKKKFCNHTCAAKYHGNNGNTGVRIGPTSICVNCGSKFQNSARKNGAGFLKRDFCDSCRRDGIVKTLSSRHHGNENAVSYIGSRTKGDLFGNRKNWQSARSSVRRHAEKIYGIKRGHSSCEICGYKEYIEVCHIKAVADFSDDSLVSEINDRSNLIGLCPNHHWEYDHGKLNIRGRTSG